MKRILFYIVIVFFVSFMASCEKDTSTEDNSVLTHYVDIQLEGEETMTLPQGSDYEDPGFVAYENEKEVSEKVDVIGEVKDDQVGFYPITYKAYNEDGFLTEITRSVIVFDPDAAPVDLSGTYNGNYAQAYFGQATLTKLANGFYRVSDFFGGIYIYDFGYPSAYVAPGYLQINPDNTIKGMGISSPWGAEEFVSGTYDPENQTFTYQLGGYGGMFQLVKQ